LSLFQNPNFWDRCLELSGKTALSGGLSQTQPGFGAAFIMEENTLEILEL
jgi:hypothetical protein